MRILPLSIANQSRTFRGRCLFAFFAEANLQRITELAERVVLINRSCLPTNLAVFGQGCRNDIAHVVCYYKRKLHQGIIGVCGSKVAALRVPTMTPRKQQKRIQHGTVQTLQTIFQFFRTN
eukprot:1892197-Amphidinium_carterae.1